MHPHQHRLVAREVALAQHDMFVPVGGVGIDAHGPFPAEFRGDGLFIHDLHQVIVAAAVGDEIADRADLKPVQLREADEVGQARHGAIFLHDLADHARRVEPGKARDIDRGLGMARAHQHTAIARTQREHMPGRRDILRALARVDGHRHRAGAVMGGNAGGHALARLDRHGEGGLVARRVMRGHQRQAERVDPLAGHRQADQAAPMRGHEIDRVGRGHLRGDDKVPLVLAILVIDEDEHPPVAGIFDDLFDGRDHVLVIGFHRTGGFKGHGVSLCACLPEGIAQPRGADQCPTRRNAGRTRRHGAPEGPASPTSAQRASNRSAT